jgi:hypothetical protein
MSRNGRGNVEHDSASRIKNAINNMPEGVSKAVDMVSGLNSSPVVKKEIPEGFKELALFGKISEDVEVGSYKFKISTISAKQQKGILKKLFLMSNEEKVANLKFLTLSEALISINGVSLESFYFGDDQTLSVDEKRSEVLLELQAVVVDKLFAKYEELILKSNSFVSNGGLEDSLKN